MELYYTPYAPIPNDIHMLATLPPARRIRHSLLWPNAGPLFVYTLLSFVLERIYSLRAEILTYTEQGKPYLPGYPLHLSLSHSKSHALCGVANVPLGCDLETHRLVPVYTRHRVLGSGESSDDFFAYWTLKESYFKLHGAFDRPFSTLTFTLAGDRATGQGTHGWLYREIPGCTAAVVAERPFTRPSLTPVAPETLFAYAAKQGTNELP